MNTADYKLTAGKMLGDVYKRVDIAKLNAAREIIIAQLAAAKNKVQHEVRADCRCNGCVDLRDWRELNDWCTAVAMRTLLRLRGACEL